MTIDEAIASYCEALTQNIDTIRSRALPLGFETLRFEPDPRGKKYMRIVRVSVNRETGEDTSRSAHFFVERSNGLIWKADGWKGPTRNFPRGSVYNLDELVLSC